MSNKVALIFDGDDTLWKTQALYEKVKQQFFDIMEPKGFDRSAVKEKLSQIEIENVAIMGFSRHRFTQSMLTVYDYFCNISSQPVNRRTQHKIKLIGYSVFKDKPELMDNALWVLNRLSKNYFLYLYTVGDITVQENKVSALQLLNFFKAIFITATKDEATLQAIINEQALHPETTWMIGNSLRSDINPALNVGLKCIWVQSDSWEYDHASLIQGKVWKVNNLTEIPFILDDFYCSRNLTFSGTL